MKRDAIRKPLFRSAVLAALLVALAASQYAAAQAPRPRRVAVFGSSVANGTGDELRKEGYTGRLRELLTPRGWEVLNQSRGGDNTRTMARRFAPDGAPQANTRYLLPVNPGYVVLGLSLGNEGIVNARTTDEKDGIFTQFHTGIRGFIDRSRQNNIVPIVTLCYTRNDFTPVEYEYTRRMNILINAWDVPSVNFLGAVDNGEGKWAEGFWNDALHPNSSGHTELLTTFVPTLFEALEKGKPTPAMETAAGFTRISAGEAPLTFVAEHTIHPFAVAMTVRAQGEGSVAAIDGKVLDAASDGKRTQLTASGPFNATIGVQDGVWVYRPANGATLKSDVKADTAWHHIVLSHYTARGETLLFVDGRLAGRTPERLQPDRFVFGGAGRPAASRVRQIDLKDVMVYRSALNADEVAVLKKGGLLQASLDVYAPLRDRKLTGGIALENRAQSLAALKVGSGSLTHVPN
jgi:lysophospholipase L1-like esterase